CEFRRRSGAADRARRAATVSGLGRARPRVLGSLGASSVTGVRRMNVVLSRHQFVADYAEAGAGPLAVLVHASMSGARQWGALTQALAGRFRVRALNLFGYGRTPAWTGTL